MASTFSRSTTVPSTAGSGAASSRQAVRAPTVTTVLTSSHSLLAASFASLVAIGGARGVASGGGGEGISCGWGKGVPHPEQNLAPCRFSRPH